MKSRWILSNNKELIPKGLDTCLFQINNFNLSINNSNSNIVIRTSENGLIFFEGFAIPRIEYLDKYKELNQCDLIREVFDEFGINFTDIVKGSFIAIVVLKNLIHIFNDHHAFRKFFYITNSNDVAISSEVGILSEMYNLKIDNEKVALYSLMEHCIEGHTFFENISYSKPATHIKIDLKSEFLSIDQYFQPLELIHQEEREISIQSFTNLWLKIIKSYTEFLRPSNVRLTLTGGNDSRMILASLMQSGSFVNMFSFGNPLSFDGIIAKHIHEKTGFPHKFHYVEQPDENWIRSYSEKIIDTGNTLINVHRAHRLDAIEKEIENDENNDMLFCGFMGGDYVKGLIYDDYITPRFINEFNKRNNKENLIQIIKRELERNYIKVENIDIDRVENLIKQLSFFRVTNQKEFEFLVLYNIVGSIHDMQDTTIFSNKVKYIINPFMDIDFLKLLYSSPYSFMSEKNHFLWKVLRLNRSKLHVQITDSLAPILSEINYAKKGHYNALEYLNDNPIMLTIKRALRLKTDRSYPQNFAYGEWIKKYCISELESLEGQLAKIYDVVKLRSYLNSLNVTSSTEGFWHLFTNPINAKLNINKFQR